MLPDAISDVKRLKALLLEDCFKLEELSYLGKLKALRELNLSGTAITKAPQGLEELLNLKFLSLRGACGLTMIPSGLSQKLVCLQHVSIPFHLQAPMQGIQYLTRLEEFDGSVDFVEDFNSFISSFHSHALQNKRVAFIQPAKTEEGEQGGNRLQLHSRNHYLEVPKIDEETASAFW